MKSWSWIIFACTVVLTLSAVTVEAQHIKIGKQTTKADKNAASDAVVLTCPKCQSEMEQGYLLEIEGQATNDKTATEWVQGPIERSFFSGVKLGGHNRLSVIAFRCKTCGYLEMYAK